MKAEQPIPTESDTNLFVISKEDIPSFTEVFSTWFGKASKEGIVPELSGKQMAVLENGTARQIQHRALLDEMGFPMYVYPENLRHPVDYDEPGRPVPSKIVNQAGQDLGDPNVEEMVKSATAAFINILRKAGDETKTRTITRYSGELPRAAVGSGARTQQASGGQLLPEQADKVNITTKSKDYEYPTRGTRYDGKVETTTYTDAPKGASSTQRTTTVPTQKMGVIVGNQPNYADDEGKLEGHLRDWSGRRVDKVTPEPVSKMNETTPVHKPNINPVDMNDYTGDEDKDAATEKGFFRETSTTAANPDRSKKRPSYGNVGDSGFLQTSLDKGLLGDVASGVGKVAVGGAKAVGGAATGALAGATGSKQTVDWAGKSVDKATALKKSTDIFKRVLEAEKPDETWTGTDKEKDVPMQKIVGLLAAPIAGAIGSAVGAGLGAVGSAAGGIAGAAGKKIIGG